MRHYQQRINTSPRSGEVGRGSARVGPVEAQQFVTRSRESTLPGPESPTLQAGGCFQLEVYSHLPLALRFGAFLRLRVRLLSFLRGIVQSATSKLALRACVGHQIGAVQLVDKRKLIQVVYRQAQLHERGRLPRWQCGQAVRNLTQRFADSLLVVLLVV